MHFNSVQLITLETTLAQFGLKITNLPLFESVFIHKSYGHEYHQESYDKLEFLGDSIINFQVSLFLFGEQQNYSEAWMSKYRQSIVRTDTLAKASVALGLDKLILLGKSIHHPGLKLQADVFEAFIAAVYLEYGMVKVGEILHATIIRFFRSKTLDDNFDYKTILQEKLQAAHRVFTYKKHKISGFGRKVSLYIENKVYVTAVGKNYKTAQNEVARLALERLAHEGLIGLE